MAIQRYDENTDDEEYPLLTKKDIANENARNRSSNILVPMGTFIYDFRQMYQIIQSRLHQIIPKRVKKEVADDLFGRLRYRPSSYLGLVGTCKFLGIPNNVLQEVKEKSIKGHVKHLPHDEQETDYKRNLDLVLESLSDHDTNPYMVIFRKKCEQWADNSTVFEDKFYPALTQYQNNIEFPKPIAIADKANKPLPPTREKQEEFIKRSASLTMEGINEVISSYTDNGSKQFNTPDQIKQYLLHYSKFYLKSCEIQLRECTMLKTSTIPDGDPNKMEFPLPSYSKIKQMRLYLLDDTYTPFVYDMPPDGYSWKHLSETDLGLYKVKTDDVNDYFEEWLAERCQNELFCTDINEEECVWKTYDKRENVIKNDILSKKQVALVKLREQRTDLFDKAKSKKRWYKHLRYFMNKYDTTDNEVYQNWFRRYEESTTQFENLCAGSFQQKVREPFNKEAYANEQYILIMSQVPKLTPQQKQRIKSHRDRTIANFAKTYQYSEESVSVYRTWFERMEQNQILLEDVCENDVQNQQTSESNYVAVFTNYSIFDTTEE